MVELLEQEPAELGVGGKFDAIVVELVGQSLQPPGGHRMLRHVRSVSIAAPGGSGASLGAHLVRTTCCARAQIGVRGFSRRIQPRFRAHDTPIRAIIAMSMLVLLGVAAAAVVYMHVREVERRTSIERARHDERLDLARELHDIVGHHVTGIVVLAQANRFTNGANSESSADRTFADIEAAGLETLTSVRRLIGLLRTDPSTSAGPRLTDVEDIVDGLRTTHPNTDLVVDDDVRVNWVPPDLANTVQRLVQEAATNVRRHGDPNAPVRFTLRSIGTSLELTVENRSLVTTSGAGYGLVGMRERVDALGGTFDAGPVGGDRWIVHAVLP